MTHAAPENDKEITETEAGATSSGGGAGLLGDLAKTGVSTNPSDASGLAKLAGKSLLRAMGALTKGSIDTANEIAHEISAGEPITEIVDHRVEQVRSAAWNALGMDDRVSSSGKRGATFKDLKLQGDALIDLSWNVANQPREEHPAFKQILDALVPDEARILRFLAVAGAQPAIDVRTKTPFNVGSERLAGGISYIADMAGCAWPDRDQHYLANLNRLGLVRFSEEPVEDYRRYSLLSAHPSADEAHDKAKKTIDIYRSIYLSLFGKQFCEACFTLEGYDAGGWVDSAYEDNIVGKGRRTYQGKHH
ncbi:Abi-alpha family protein [Antrihabitans spumae]|uniref:Abi-alpha family protein n=1 Tax=Antrihabitans spumae TaxID=3373370 RepID=A0ABW7KUF7_9NOCA